LFASAVRPNGHADPVEPDSSSWLPASWVCPRTWSHRTLQQSHPSTLQWDVCGGDA